MHITSDKDFTALRLQFIAWRKRFPMFAHDVSQIERIIDSHIQKHSIALVLHRQTHSKTYLAEAQEEINAINKIIITVEKIELMSMLSRG